jgi:flagellar biogenesis protein FliO
LASGMVIIIFFYFVVCYLLFFEFRWFTKTRLLTAYTAMPVTSARPTQLVTIKNVILIALTLPN